MENIYLVIASYYVLMPVVAVIAGVKIYMYFKDHQPPHFHAKEDSEEEVFDLEGNSLKGAISPKKSKKIRKWAKENNAFLNDQWEEYQK